MYVTYVKKLGDVVNTLVDIVKWINPEVGEIVSTVLGFLSKAGKAFLEVYAPKVWDLLFKSEGVDDRIREFIDELEQVHADLAEHNQILLDELQDQFGDDRIGDLITAKDMLHEWQSHPDPILRMTTSRDFLFTAFELVDNVRNDLQVYLSGTAGDLPGSPSGNMRAQFKRLQLLPLHIEATRLFFLTKRLYWNWQALKNAFEAVHGEASTNTAADFEAWRDGLSAQDLEDIQTIADGESHGGDPALDDVLEFYERLTTRDDIGAYVDAIFTPMVGHMETFQGNAGLYFDTDEVGDVSNWDIGGDPEDAVAVLDGDRWYYYVDVASADCLDGYAYRWLGGGEFPYAEDPDDPSQSECNRYWIVRTRATLAYRYKGSFDQYGLWFSTASEIYEMHKELVKGDFLRLLYGPNALILDALYRELRGGTRPANAWDEAMARYDELVGLLASGADTFDDALALSEALRTRCGVTPTDPSLLNWCEMLQMQAADPLNPPMCPDRFEDNQSWATAAEIEPGFHAILSLNVPSDVDIYRFELLADNAVLIDLQFGDDAFTRPPVVEFWQQLPEEDEPTLVASASDHDTFGWSIVLPRRADGTYRHRRTTGFIKVHSESGETGQYALGVQTKGAELVAYEGSESEDSGGDTTGTFTATTETWFPADDAPIAWDRGEPYRIEPEETEEDPGLSLDIHRSKTVRSTIHTGGGWITNHALLGQTAGADIDRFVVEVPPNLTLRIHVVPSNPDFGCPHAELEDRDLAERATVDLSAWPEGGHTITWRNHGYGARDVHFRVSGLHSDNYRRDTGAYRLTATVEGMIGVWHGLNRLQRIVADALHERMPSHHDIGAFESMYVEFFVVKGPDNPGDPFVLAAIDNGTGSVIGHYKIDASGYASQMPFRAALKAFNKARMGPVSAILKHAAKVPDKFK